MARVKNFTYEDLTKVDKAEYIKRGGVSCPFCRSQNVNPHESLQSNESGEMEQTIECRNCWRQWTDTYSITSVASEELLCGHCQQDLTFGEKVKIVGNGIVHVKCPEVELRELDSVED